MESVCALDVTAGGPELTAGPPPSLPAGHCRPAENDKIHPHSRLSRQQKDALQAQVLLSGRPEGLPLTTIPAPVFLLK